MNLFFQIEYESITEIQSNWSIQLIEYESITNI